MSFDVKLDFSLLFSFSSFSSKSNLFLFDFENPDSFSVSSDSLLSLKLVLSLFNLIFDSSQILSFFKLLSSESLFKSKLVLSLDILDKQTFLSLMSFFQVKLFLSGKFVSKVGVLGNDLVNLGEQFCSFSRSSFNLSDLSLELLDPLFSLFGGHI